MDVDSSIQWLSDSQLKSLQAEFMAHYHYIADRQDTYHDAESTGLLGELLSLVEKVQPQIDELFHNVVVRQAMTIKGECMPSYEQFVKEKTMYDSLMVKVNGFNCIFSNTKDRLGKLHPEDPLARGAKTAEVKELFTKKQWSMPDLGKDFETSANAFSAAQRAMVEAQSVMSNYHENFLVAMTKSKLEHEEAIDRLEKEKQAFELNLQQKLDNKTFEAAQAVMRHENAIQASSDAHSIEMGRLEKENQEMKNELARVKLELASGKVELKTLNASRESLQEQLNAERQALVEEKEDLEDAEEEVKELSQVAERYQDTILTQNTCIRGLKDKKQGYLDQIRQLKKRVQDSAEKNSKLEGDNAGLLEQLGLLSEALQEEKLTDVYLRVEHLVATFEIKIPAPRSRYRPIGISGPSLAAARPRTATVLSNGGSRRVRNIHHRLHVMVDDLDEDLVKDYLECMEMYRELAKEKDNRPGEILVRPVSLNVHISVCMLANIWCSTGAEFALTINLARIGNRGLRRCNWCSFLEVYAQRWQLWRLFCELFDVGIKNVEYNDNTQGHYLCF